MKRLGNGSNLCLLLGSLPVSQFGTEKEECNIPHTNNLLFIYSPELGVKKPWGLENV